MRSIPASLGLCLVANLCIAHELTMEHVEVKGRQINLIGEAMSASEGLVGQSEIRIRPLSRTGEVLELIPGMVVTQHSGSGKANQYFLRGFNLDHGTDFATFVDGMPVNMRSHGHGQGYTDLSFLIPEAIGKLSYRKGAYYADIGDFSGAGGAFIETAYQLEDNSVSLSLGEDGYQRGLALSNFTMGYGNALIAIERQHYDGPWEDIDEDVGKTNVLFKYSEPLSDGQVSLSFMGYENSWNSADQIPERAVSRGIIDELGSIDDSVGGESSRYSVSVNVSNGAWRGSVYIIDYDLNLWSNFTYFLDDETNGDQFEQVDDRRIYGGSAEYANTVTLAEQTMDNRVGVQFRVDDIQEVGLYQTRQRQRLGVTRSDKIKQSSASLYWENQIQWNHHLRTVLGVRYDSLRFDVDDNAGINRFGVDLNNNGGTANDDLLSLKASAVYSINNAWEVYLSAGQGFHSNDARGTTITVDPASGDALEKVDPLVRSEGFEFGLRGFVGDRLNLSAALWSLKLDSELLFVGDAGNTEASRPSHREGVEFVAYYRFTDYISADLEYAYSDAEFRGSASEGDEIPGAARDVVQLGLNIDMGEAWFGSLRYRYFGERPLIEDGSIKSDSTASFNLRIGYAQSSWRVTLDVLNLTDSDDHDIDYFYASRLANEPAGMGTEDNHFHPLEPRQLRLTMEYQW